MDFEFIFNKAKNIIIKPSTQWHNIKNENLPGSVIYKKYVIPFILLICVSAILGDLIFNSFSSIKYPLFNAAQIFTSYFFSLYISNNLIYIILDRYESGISKDMVINLLSFSLTAEYLANIISRFHHSLMYAGIFGLFSIYLLWKGTDILFNIDVNKKIIYVSLIVLFLIGFNIIINHIFFMFILKYVYHI